MVHITTRRRTRRRRRNSSSSNKARALSTMIELVRVSSRSLGANGRVFSGADFGFCSNCRGIRDAQLAQSKTWTA